MLTFYMDGRTAPRIMTWIRSTESRREGGLGASLRD